MNRVNRQVMRELLRAVNLKSKPAANVLYGMLVNAHRNHPIRAYDWGRIGNFLASEILADPPIEAGLFSDQNEGEILDWLGTAAIWRLLTEGKLTRSRVGQISGAAAVDSGELRSWIRQKIEEGAELFI